MRLVWLATSDDQAKKLQTENLDQPELTDPCFTIEPGALQKMVTTHGAGNNVGRTNHK
jgi:hypothetical protein